MASKWILTLLFVVAAAAQSATTQAQAKFRISGTVVDAVRGEALPDIEVSISVSQAESVLHTVITGPDGRFEFAGLAPTKYSLSGRGNGYLPQGYEQHHSYFTGVVAGPGFESENLTFRLKPDASISGVVTDEFGDPVPLAEVLLFSSVTEAAQAVVFRRKVIATDAGGFELIHLPEGKYFLAVTSRPWYARDDPAEDEEETPVIPNAEAATPEEPSRSKDTTVPVKRHSELDVAFQTRYYVDATEPEQATPIVLKPGDRATADFHLFAVPAVHLKIRGVPAFKNATGPLVLWERIFSYSRQVASRGVDDEGAELDSLSPGRYLLELPPQAPGGLPQQRPLDLVTDTEIVPGEGSRSVSTVTGNVRVDGTGVFCQRCNVRLVSLASGEVFAAQNSPTGFQIEGGVRPGSYVVGASNTEGYSIKELSAGGAKVVGTQLEIQSGATVLLSIVVTKDTGTINGVALWHGKPVSQAAVFLVPTDPAHNATLIRGDQSDSDGTFSLRRVLPGDYTVIAVSEGWDLEWTNPAALRPFLAGGLKVRVQPGSKDRIEVAVQPLEGNAK